jgi:transcriptional regulator with XRE-family HTH domain
MIENGETMTIRRAELVRRRVLRGFTQEALAEHLGVERSTVARWERDTVTPQPWVRSRLAAALAVTADQLNALLTSLTVKTPQVAAASMLLTLRVVQI